MQVASQSAFNTSLTTGSGKTMGYAVPGICTVMKDRPVRPGDGPISLVLCPTRELATQIQESYDKVEDVPTLR